MSCDASPCAMHDPLVSIVIPTRNRHLMCRRAVDSALSQTLGAVEVIVVDDGSDVHWVPHRFDPRLTVLRNDLPRGPCGCRNAGMEIARGKWITFLDDDDELESGMLERGLQAASASKLPRPVSILSATRDYRDGEACQRIALPMTLPRNSRYSLEPAVAGRTFYAAVPNTLLVEREVLEAIGGWDERLPPAEHCDLLLRVNQVSSLQGVDIPGYHYHIHDGDRLSRDVLARAKSMSLTLAKHAAVFATARKRAAKYTSACGVCYLRGGQWWNAVSMGCKAVSLCPGNARYWGRLAASVCGPRAVRTIRRLQKYVANHLLEPFTILWRSLANTKKATRAPRALPDAIGDRASREPSDQ